MVGLDARLGEQLLDVAVGQAEAQVPADRQHDHLGGEAETGEGGAWNRSKTRLAGFSCWQPHWAARSQPMQQHLRGRPRTAIDSAVGIV